MAKIVIEKLPKGLEFRIINKANVLSLTVPALSVTTVELP